MSKAFFIYRNGKPCGNPTGYTTEKGAKKSLVGCDDWYRLLKKYEYISDEEITDEMKECGMYYWSEYVNEWMLDRKVWSRKIWAPYVKEHYQIIEQDYNIKVKNS